MQIRLNKLLAQRGVASRREADRLIEEGSVEVNGVVVQELGTKVDDAADGIAVKGPTLPDGVFPVGRLDCESEGLLLLTNDGELAFRLTHPRYEVPKVYIVRVEGAVPAETIAKLEAGVLVEGKKTAPAKVKALETREAFTVLQVEIHEGRKREIRLMFSSVGHEVIRLERASFGGIKLERLEPGRWRFLKAAEVRRLKQLVGLESQRD